MICCEICEGDAKLWGEIKGYKHYKCAVCEHLFVYPRPSQSELNEFYQLGKYYEKAESEVERLLADGRRRLMVLSKLGKRYELSKTLLDVGCASGHFLSESQGAGWDVAGLERSSKIASQARSNYGIDVISGSIEDTELYDRSFDVVTAWEVIEHAENPVKFLSEIVKNVKQGGLLAISTPMSDGWIAKIMGERYPMIIPPEHLSLFSKKSIRLLANKNSLKEVYFQSFSGLSTSSLASGYCQIITRRRMHNIFPIFRIPFYMLGIATGWMPWLVDKLGKGSEMMVIFQKEGV